MNTQHDAPQNLEVPDSEERPADQNGNFAADEDKLADEWGLESFPASDPPANF